MSNIMRDFSESKRAASSTLNSQPSTFRCEPSDAKIEIGKAAEEIRLKADLKARLLPEIAKWIAARTNGRETGIELLPAGERFTVGRVR